MASNTHQDMSSSPGSPSRINLPGRPSAETFCLQLGWSMQRLYRGRPVQESDSGILPERLPGLSRLTRLTRIEIDYGRAQECLKLISGTLSLEREQLPDITEIKTRLDVFQKPEGRTRPVATGDPVKDYKDAVLDSHLSLMTAITAMGATLGKAYSLGRALADTARPNQSQASLQESFDPYRLAQLRHDLNDLVSVLPEHSAKAVAQSLTWWRDAVYLADDSETGKDRRLLLNSIRTDVPELRRPRGILNPKITVASSSGSLDALRQALPRQGELWRVVLTGEKKPLDLLTPDDYLEAAQRAVAGGRKIAARTFLTAPKTSLSVFLLVTALLAGVLIVVDNSHASGGGKLAAFLVAVGGYFVSLARAVTPRLKAAAIAVEQPLWQSALDYVSAEGISIPPVGRPDPSGWSRLSEVLATTTVPGALSPPEKSDGKQTEGSTSDGDKSPGQG